MLDVFDFIVEKGGNPEKIKESQRRRYAPEAAVDEVIALYEDHRKSKLTLHGLSYILLLILIFSTIFGFSDQYQDQRYTKTNRCEEEGEGERR